MTGSLPEDTGDVEALLVARMAAAMRAYLRLREAAGPDSAATLLAARALDRACEEALSFEQDGLPPRHRAPRAGSRAGKHR